MEGVLLVAIVLLALSWIQCHGILQTLQILEAGTSLREEDDVKTRVGEVAIWTGNFEILFFVRSCFVLDVFNFAPTDWFKVSDWSKLQIDWVVLFYTIPSRL